MSLLLMLCIYRMSKLLSSAANLWPFINIHVSAAAGINTEHSSGLIIPAFSAPPHRDSAPGPGSFTTLQPLAVFCPRKITDQHFSLSQISES